MQHRVEPADVDAELEGVGGREPDELAAAQRVLERAALLGQVAAAVGRDLPGQRRVDLGRAAPRRVIATCSTPRRERTKASVRTPVDDQVGQQVGGLRGRGAAYRGAVLAGAGGQRRLPQRQREPPARGGVVGHGHDVETGQPRRGTLRLGDRGRGQDERRVRAVVRADPPQPAQHLGDVGAEDAAVVVALVDDDEAQRPRNAAHRSWPGSSERCSMSGLVSTYSAWSRAQSRCSRLLSPSWVVIRTSRPSPASECQLVVGQRLGRGEVEHGRAALVPRAAGRADAVQGGQLVGQRLARGGAGGEHDVLAGVGGVGRDDLVAPGLRDAAPGEARPTTSGSAQAGQLGVTRRAGREHLEVGQPPLAPGTAASRWTSPVTGRRSRAGLGPARGGPAALAGAARRPVGSVADGADSPGHRTVRRPSVHRRCGRVCARERTAVVSYGRPDVGARDVLGGRIAAARLSRSTTWT